MRTFHHIAIVLLLVGCTAREPLPDSVVGQPVQFIVGGEALVQAQTKSATNMASGGRFVCSMYYHAANGNTNDSNYDIVPLSAGGTMTTAWLEVDNSGTPQYKNMGFTAPAPTFYWQNRLKHAFLAQADYNKLNSNVGAITHEVGDRGKLKMYPNGENYSGTYNAYDLSRGERTSMDQQPDPILAWTVVAPVGTTSETVLLTFQHQFSQVQVNVKGATDGPATITAGQIEKVELLGVSTEGYVPNRLNADGTVSSSISNGVAVNNPFELFGMTEAASGYLKSAHAIAFGVLRGIRVTWHEAGDNTIKHTPTYTLADPLTLESGNQYIYNLEIRIGGISLIQTQIENWGQKGELVFDSATVTHN